MMMVNDSYTILFLGVITLKSDHSLSNNCFASITGGSQVGHLIISAETETVHRAFEHLISVNHEEYCYNLIVYHVKENTLSNYGNYFVKT